MLFQLRLVVEVARETFSKRLSFFCYVKNCGFVTIFFSIVLTMRVSMH